MSVCTTAHTRTLNNLNKKKKKRKKTKKNEGIKATKKLDNIPMVVACSKY